MIILNRTPVTLGEAKSLVNDLDENKNLSDYFKKFSKVSKEDCLKLVEEIKSLNNLKVREENIIKIADFLPETSEDVNKIFNDVSLTEEEINAILAIVKKY